MKKKMLTFSLAAVMLAGSVFSVSAAGVKDVLSTDYYASKYSDLKSAYGTNTDAYVAHFLASGAKEGRVMNPILDVAAYRKAYADLNAAFGDDWDAYVNHYLTVGIKEKRTTGVLFDLVDYVDKNPDLKTAYGDDYVAIANQYVTYGIKEGRPGGAIVAEVEEVEDNSSAPAPTEAEAPKTTETPKETETPAPVETPDPVQTITDNHEHQKGYKGTYLAPTCTEAGYQEWKCLAPVYKQTFDKDGNLTSTKPTGEVCDVVWRETLDPKHSAPGQNQNIYIVHPTCTATGLRKYTCTACGKEITEEIDMLEHDYSQIAPVVKVLKDEASKSCREEDRGYKETQTTKECFMCHKKVTTTEKEAYDLLPHKFSGASLVRTEATCTGWGENYGYCDVCKTEITVKVEPTGHIDVKDEPFDVYADTYLLGDERPSHYAYAINYCKNNGCGPIITYVDPDAKYDPATTVPCEDLDGNMACDQCGLRMDRQVTQQIKVYEEGETFIGKVQ